MLQFQMAWAQIQIFMETRGWKVQGLITFITENDLKASVTEGLVTSVGGLLTSDVFASTNCS